ncbi:MAG: hypothetical protein ACI9KN_000289 [Gammaproteobacteria bacterium]
MQRKLLVFAETAGELVFPAVRFQGEIESLSTDSTTTELKARQILRQTPPIKLTVREQAPTFTGKYWLPMTELNFSQHWSGLDKDLKTGDSISRTLILHATGLPADRLPDDLFELENDDLVVYPD